ncbi:MAG: dTDP-glucose 4,6-dehydratase [Deltaproteobacteria bacterium]|nr:dTDP-glucose 4,6-dehydratase [Deltaproteobacteria bacterium]
MTQKLLVTGGAGFIGANFIRLALQEGRAVVNLDALTYAGNLENLEDVAKHPDYTFIKGDIAEREVVTQAMEGADAVVNFAAESHVDRSIDNPDIFLRTNVMGTQVLLDEARHRKLGRFLQVSTDEVYGSLGETGKFREDSALAPNSPYSASKTGADLLVRAYHKTYGLATLTTRCSNNYGPLQFPEKLIPLMVTNAVEGKELPVYGDGKNVRDWIHVEDHCRALLLVLDKGRDGEIYNIGGAAEWQNIDLVRAIIRIVGASEEQIRFVKDRPGHDRRYAIDSSKIEDELGFQRTYDFETGLAQTVAWYREHQTWWEQVKSGAYRDYYAKMYGERPDAGGDL